MPSDRPARTARAARPRRGPQTIAAAGPSSPHSPECGRAHPKPRRQVGHLAAGPATSPLTPRRRSSKNISPNWLTTASNTPSAKGSDSAIPRRQSIAGSLAASNGEHALVAIEADNRTARLNTPRRFSCQNSRSARHIENLLARRELRRIRDSDRPLQKESRHEEFLVDLRRVARHLTREIVDHACLPCRSQTLICRSSARLHRARACCGGGSSAQHDGSCAIKVMQSLPAARWRVPGGA